MPSLTVKLVDAAAVVPQVVVICNADVLLELALFTGFGVKVWVVPAGRVVVMLRVKFGPVPPPCEVKPMV